LRVQNSIGKKGPLQCSNDEVYANPAEYMKVTHKHFRRRGEKNTPKCRRGSVALECNRLLDQSLLL